MTTDMRRTYESCSGALTACAVVALTCLAPASAFALETISGIIRSATTGAPLQGIDLDVFDASTGRTVAITGDTTGAAGNYTVTLPGPGSYVIRTDPTAAQGVASQYYNGVFLKSQAQPIVAAIGSATMGVDFSLPAGVILSGTVTSGGLGIAGVDIDVFADNGEFLGAYNAKTAADGSYAVGALPPGNYVVRADPDIALNTQLFTRTYFAGSADLLGATLIPVGTTDVSGIDMALTPGGTIKGVVTAAASGLPLANIDLDLFDLTGKRINVQAKSDLIGLYEIGAVPSGSYLLRVDPSLAQGYARTYYVSSAAESSAAPIAVVAGSRTGNVDFAIADGGTLSGTIRASGIGTPLANIDLDLFDSFGSFLATYTAKTDVAGNYQMGPLAPGTYFIRADPTVAQGYADQFWPAAVDLVFASAVTISVGADTALIDFDLVSGSAVTGTVRDIGGMALSGIDLDLFDAATGSRLRQGSTSTVDGTYRFDSLAPGGYLVRADPTGIQGFARQYFNGQLAKAVADVVVTGAGAATTGVDFALDLAGTLSGQVLDAGGVPVAGMDMDVFNGQGLGAIRMDQPAVTDVTGNYLFEALPPGNYIVRADPDPAVSLPVYHPATTDPALATLIPLAPGQAAVGKNVTLGTTLSSAQSTAQQSCLTALHKDLARVDKTQGREILRCIKKKAGGKLSGTVENCIIQDAKGKLAKAASRTVSDFNRRCVAQLPTIGATDPQVVNDVGRQEETNVAHRMFGVDLDVGIVTSANGATRSVSSCQLALSKQAAKCSLTRISGFSRCLKNGLKSAAVVSAGTLSSCLDQDPAGRIAKACGPVAGKLGRIIGSRCNLAPAELSAALPGCAGATAGVAECVDGILACSVCTGLNTADALGRDCDLYDDGTANSSCQ